MAEITDIQQARAIIKAVGEPHQCHVVDMLRSITYVPSGCRSEYAAQNVIENMEHEYSLNVANALWVEKYDEIPDYIKNYSTAKSKKE